VASRPRGTIRLWQTGLFIIVIVVAMLILSATLSAGLTTTLTRMAETSELRNASALAQRLAPDFPISASGTSHVAEVVAEYRGIYGGGIWVYDGDGTLRESAHDAGPVEAVLQSARDAVLGGKPSYAVIDLRTRRGARGRRRHGELRRSARRDPAGRPRPPLGRVLGIARHRGPAGVRVLRAHRQANQSHVGRGGGDRCR
jgi:hypothetical protein